jgi:hypothetical protein
LLDILQGLGDLGLDSLSLLEFGISRKLFEFLIFFLDELLVFDGLFLNLFLC